MTLIALGAALMCWPRLTLTGDRVAALVGVSRLAGAAGTERRQVPLPGTRHTVGAAVLAGLAIAVPAGALLGGATAAALYTGARVLCDIVGRRRSAASRGRLRAAVRVAAAELEAGTPLPAALRAGGTVDAVALEHLDPIRPVVAVSDRTGAPIADLLGRIEADLRAEDDRQRAVTAALAGPRSSALVLALLPAVGLVLGIAMGAHPLQVLAGTPALLAAGVVLDCLGVLWTLRIVSSAARA